MRYLLDTNLIIEAVGGTACAVSALKTAVESEWVGYSAITRLELFGYPDLTGPEEQALVEAIAELNEVGVDSAIIDRAIMIRKANKRKAPDAIIAATAVINHAVLITRNSKDFEGIEGLELLNPWRT